MDTLKPDVVYTLYGVYGLLCKFALNPIFNSYTKVTLLAAGEPLSKGLTIYVRDTLFNDPDTDGAINVQTVMVMFIKDFRLRQNIIKMEDYEDVRGLQYMTRTGMLPYPSCIRIGDTFYPTAKIASSHLGICDRVIKDWCASSTARTVKYTSSKVFA